MTNEKFYVYIYEDGFEIVPYGIGKSQAEALEETKKIIVENEEDYNELEEYLDCYECSKAAYEHLKENNDGIAFMGFKNVVVTAKEARTEYCGDYPYDPEEFSHDEVKLLRKVYKGEASLSLAKEEKEEHGIDLSLDDDDVVLCEFSTGRYYYLRIEGEEITGIYEKEPVEA